MGFSRTAGAAACAGLALSACGGVVDSRPTGEPSPDAGTTVLPDGSASLPTAADGAPLDCDGLVRAAEGEIQAAMLAAASDTACTRDQDCSVVSTSIDCIPCITHVPASPAAARDFRTTLDQIGRTYCGAMTGQSCKVPAECQPFATWPAAACVDGRCELFPPSDWKSFVLDEGTAEYAASPPSVPPRCEPGLSCTVWALSPDGSITRTNAGTVTPKQLSTEDLAAVDQAIRSHAFRLGVRDGFSCDPPPEHTRVTFDIEYDASGTASVDVTGCALSGPWANDAMRIYETFRAY